MKLDEIRITAKKIFSERDEILIAYIYGSYLKGQYYNDIDIGIIIQDDFEPFTLYEPRISRYFDKYLHENIDVRILNHKPLRFLYNLLKNSKVLFSRDENKRIKFECKVVKEYLDIKPHHIMYNEMRRLRYETG